jgi:hypothetical protein
MVDAQEIRELIDGHFEWLLVRDAGSSFPLYRTEIEIERRGTRVLIGLPDDRGFRSWPVKNFLSNENPIEVEMSGIYGKDK